MNIDLKNAGNGELKLRAVELLAQGVVPYTNWANVFANPKLSDWPGLQAKAFHVWFPTMNDYLAGRYESRAIEKELSNRKEDCENVFELSEQLEKCFENVLSLYTTHEQIFIRDRRLQNVHGKLQINTFENHDIKVFNGKTRAVERVKISAEEYRNIITPFYSDLAGYSREFISRFLESQEFKELTELYIGHLKIDDHLMPLIARLGVPALAGNG